LVKGEKEMIVSEFRGRAHNISVADLVLNPTTTSSPLYCESGLISSVGNSAQLGGSGSGGTSVPSYSGKHLRVVYEGLVTQDSGHTDAIFYGGITFLSFPPGTTINPTIPGFEPQAANLFIDFSVRVPEYPLVNSFGFQVFAPYELFAISSDGSSFQTAGTAPISDNLGFNITWNIQDGGSGLPTVTVRTRRFFLEFLDN
jgi:hypothetical protein